MMARRPRHSVYSSDEDEEEIEMYDHDYDGPVPKSGKRHLGKTRWTREEDEKLKKLVEHHGTEDWKVIASFLPNRTDVQCQHRWQKVLNPELIKGPWTKEEDQRVIELVQKYGPKRWSVIAKHLKGRIGKQCRERWHNHLNPEVKKTSWTEEEDRIIFQAHKRLGNRWAEIAKLLPGRTDNAIKNHWNSTMRRKVEQEGYLQLSPKTGQPPLAANYNKSNHIMGFAHSSTPTQIPTTQPTMNGDYQYYHIPETQSIPGPVPFPVALHVNILNIPQPAAVSVQRQYNDEDPEKEKRIKELELLLMSTENELRGQQALPSQVPNYSGWNATVMADNSGSHGDNVNISCLGEQQQRSAPLDHGCHPEDRASPARSMAVNQNNGMSPLPEFTETLQLIDSDPSTWADLSSFELLEVADASPCKTPSNKCTELQQKEGTVCESSEHTNSRLNKSMLCQDSPALLKSLSASKFAASPAVSLRKLKGIANHSASGDSSTFTIADFSCSTPKRSPVKSLPFSPSQFFNTSGNQVNLEIGNPSLTSTPVCIQKSMITTPLHRDHIPKPQKENDVFRTPNIRRSIMETSPRTPTPFKTALALQEIKYGPLKMLPQTPHLEQDLEDVIKQEAVESGIATGLHEDEQPLLKKIKQEVESPCERIRHALQWEEENLNTQLFTQGNSLEDAPNLLTSSMLMMPVSDKNEDNLIKAFNMPRRSLGSPLQVKIWGESVACGKTEDQMLVTEQARKYINTFSTRTLVM
ncbi:transcriptional activator Myb-like isoform X2 [Acipenser ruthenus]|uniref:transcriptional activator Myb-like isoform X2 n=1 Tax=Acipenser ruthenus TaxID=7906 RepID=UPI00145A6003|nr:transcriptional activator Myb-like isoform X2 [Acipenser ruthenus]